MSVDTKYGEAIFKQTQEVAEMFKAAMPKITTNKNGYEIRTKVLEMAQTMCGKITMPSTDNGKLQSTKKMTKL